MTASGGDNYQEGGPKRVWYSVRALSISLNAASRSVRIMSGSTSTRKLVPAIHAAFPVLRVSFQATVPAWRPTSAAHEHASRPVSAAVEHACRPFSATVEHVGPAAAASFRPWSATDDATAVHVVIADSM
ncbi:uncharacterized protein [Triticum aestivum]|uniref:uncharacterized protein n=1 Tax=Triticum aestivum TaxID=4565 RepID=UPI001D004AD4|nr:uncharacterized protein LOC123117802 [Triticum aestivum]